MQSLLSKLAGFARPACRPLQRARGRSIDELHLHSADWQSRRRKVVSPMGAW